MPHSNVATELFRIGSPLGRDRFMAPGPVLIGEAAESRIACAETFAFGVRGDDQAMGERSGRKTTFQLNREVPACAARVVLLDISEEIFIGRAEDRSCELAPPRRLIGADDRPKTAGAQVVAATVERVRVRAGEEVEAIEFAPPAERQRRRSNFNIIPRMPGSAQPS